MPPPPGKELNMDTEQEDYLASPEYDAQALIDSGMAWRLEGAVGRACMDALDGGYAVLGPEGIRDYWGNYVPSRDEVLEGTRGSVSYALARLDEREDNGEDVDEVRARILALTDKEA